MRFFILLLSLNCLALEVFELKELNKTDYLKMIKKEIEQLNLKEKEIFKREKDLSSEISTLIDKQGYLEKYAQLLESKVECAKMKEHLVFSFSPQNPNPKTEDIPSAAQEVIDLAQKTCPK